MAFEDRSPEGRNLSATSIGFFIYYAGGGYFRDGTVSLQMINLSFTNFELLGWCAWGMLAWFAFRYGVETKKAPIDYTHEALDIFLVHQPLARRALSKKAGTLPPGAERWDIKGAGWRGFLRWEVALTPSKVSGSGLLNRVGEQRMVELVWRKDLKLQLQGLAYAFATKPEISRVMVPWLLFAMALAAAAYTSLTGAYTPLSEGS